MITVYNGRSYPTEPVSPRPALCNKFRLFLEINRLLSFSLFCFFFVVKLFFSGYYEALHSFDPFSVFKRRFVGGTCGGLGDALTFRPIYRWLLLISGRHAAQFTDRRTRRSPPRDRTRHQPKEDISRRSGQKGLFRPIERSVERFQENVLCMGPARQPLPPLAPNRNHCDFNSDEKASDRLCRKP